MTGEELIKRDLPGTWDEIDLRVIAEIGKEIQEGLSLVGENHLPTAMTINSVIQFILHTSTFSILSVERTRRELEEDLRACIDEAAQNYAEYETSELKRRFDRVIERHNERFERQAEALESIQDQLRKGLDSSDTS